ncbi:unnamed protein product [Phyllotreta striolata]|uniref:Neuropeptide-like 4 n=1 Tax=Phyllotreta striolata TaxID=444603 RepID=A0A9N9TUA4_PHYSR|nr:unnamed protein product [Phyllotreta striolata]
MFKICLVAAVLAVVGSTPIPEANPIARAVPAPKALPKPDYYAYAAPLVAAPYAYASAYSTPLAYSSYAYPYSYYSYSAPYVVV